MILVDTSVLIDYLRGKSTPAVAVLAKLDSSNMPFAIPLVCCQEILQGARDENEWRALARVLSTQYQAIPEEPTSLHWEAARIFFDCRRRGVTVRSSVDCLIAAQALAAKAPLLHDDEDFERIRKVRPEFVTRRG
jgi:predicted nucleic acid-binding protein